MVPLSRYVPHRILQQASHVEDPTQRPLAVYFFNDAVVDRRRVIFAIAAAHVFTGGDEFARFRIEPLELDAYSDIRHIVVGNVFGIVFRTIEAVKLAVFVDIVFFYLPALPFRMGRDQVG